MKLKQWFDMRIASHRATRLLRSRFPGAGGKYSVDEWAQAYRDLGLPESGAITLLQALRDKGR
jgi:hypothetical protein